MQSASPESEDAWSDEAIDGLLHAAAPRRPARPERPRRTLFVAAALAAAACALLVAWPREAAPLHYEVGTVRGGLAETRGAGTPASSVRAAADTSLTVRLRPARAQAAPTCRVYARCDGPARRLDATCDPAPGGGLSVTGKASAWFGARAARCSLWFGLGAVDGAPPEAPGSGPGWQWLALAVDYRGTLGAAP